MQLIKRLDELVSVWGKVGMPLRVAVTRAGVIQPALDQTLNLLKLSKLNNPYKANARI